MEPGIARGGWQHEAVSIVDRHFRQEVLFERMGSRDRAILRSQGGSGAGLALTVSPTTLMTKIPPHLFRTILLRRLRLPLPFSRCMCRCGRPIDSFGHHRASCTRTGALGRRGFALENAAARVCREAGARVTTNVLVRDLDLPLPVAADNRRLEVVADGLPIFGGSQLALDTTLVCALHCDGSPHTGAADTDGVVLQRARRRKERRYPELVGRGSRARLVVWLRPTLANPILANPFLAKIGGKWSVVGQFWPIQCWPILFWPIRFRVLCCGWFWCGLVFCVGCFFNLFVLLCVVWCCVVLCGVCCCVVLCVVGVCCCCVVLCVLLCVCLCVCLCGLCCVVRVVVVVVVVVVVRIFGVVVSLDHPPLRGRRGFT